MKRIIIRGDSKCCSVCGCENLTKLAEVTVNDRSWVDFVEDDGSIIMFDEMKTANCPICGTQPIMDKLDFLHEKMNYWLFCMKTGQTFSFSLQAIIDIANQETRCDRMNGEEYTWRNVHEYWLRNEPYSSWKFWKEELQSDYKANERGEK